MSVLPNGWCELSLRDVTEPFALTDPTKTPEKIFKYVDIGSIDNNSRTITQPKSIKGADAPSRARRVIHTNDTLFSTVRTYLKNIALVPAELDGQLTSTGVSILRPNEALDPKYLFLWASSDDFVEKVSVAQDGTMYPAVSDSDVLEGLIRLPPLQEQRRIVAKMDSLSGKCKRARDQLDHIPRLVDKYKRAILSAAFAGNVRPAENGTKYNSVPFSHVIASTFYGPRIASNAYVKTGIPTLRTTDIGDWGQLVLRDPPQVLVTDAEFTKWGLEDQDLLVTRTGATIGKCTLYNKKVGPALPSAYLIRVRLKPDLVIGKFALFYLLSPEGEDQLLAGRTAVAQPNINARAISAVSIPLPKIETQHTIVQAIEAAFACIDRLASEAVKARKLVDHLEHTILDKAVQGELLPQDPTDEPASVLLARIGAGREVAPTVRRRRNGGREALAPLSSTGAERTSAMRSQGRSMSTTEI